MHKFEDLLPRRVAPPGLATRPKVERLDQPLTLTNRKPYAVYEEDVFNFLLANSAELGIASVLRFRGLLADGAIDLTNGHRIVLEIKYRMNWMKACQSEWQFRRCLLTPEAQTTPVTGGLVFFEEFTQDWADVGGGRSFPIGWYHWYTGNSEIEGLPLDLVRFADGALEWCPLPSLSA